MKKINVRKINRKDMQKMCELNKIAGFCYDESDLVEPFFDNEFQVETVFVAEIDGTYVGHIELFEGHKSSIGKFMLIRRLVIHPDWRRKGIGRELMNFAIEECKRKGIRNLDGLIDEDNAISKNMFKSLGFEDVSIEIHVRKKI